MSDITVQHIKTYCERLQKEITDAFSAMDSKAFLSDEWVREQGGGGRSCVLQEGTVFEQVGVNISHVYGDNLPPSATKARPELVGCGFEAVGLSLVAHLRNPYAPTSHMNVRFFQSQPKDDRPPVWWFGGGYDLTPYYGFEEDCVHWHQTAYDACAPFGEEVYPELKKWCDDYFYLPHRQEPRGIGGLFYDDWHRWPKPDCFAFMQSVGDSYLKAYTPLVQKRHQMAYDAREREFQLYRRGRYVEFNLLYDRGTLFGLQSGGRTESILMSLPPLVRWGYQYQAPKDSVEARLTQDYLCGRAWL